MLPSYIKKIYYLESHLGWKYKFVFFKQTSCSVLKHAVCDGTDQVFDSGIYIVFGFRLENGIVEHDSECLHKKEKIRLMKCLKWQKNADKIQRKKGYREQIYDAFNI